MTKYKVKKDGTRIVDADDSLQEKVGVTPIAKVISNEKVNKAKQTVEKRKDEFDDIAMKNIADIRNIVQKISGKKASEVPEDLQLLRDEILNLKSNAGIYDYVLVTSVARSLYEYIINVTEFGEEVQRVIQLHVLPINLILKEQTHGDGGAMGATLVSELEELTKKFL